MQTPITENENIFESRIGNNFKVMMYPLDGSDLMRVEVFYHLTYSKKRSQYLSIGDAYRCGDDPTKMIEFIRRRFQKTYSLKLREETMKKIGRALVEGCGYFKKPEPKIEP